MYLFVHTREIYHFTSIMINWLDLSKEIMSKYMFVIPVHKYILKSILKCGTTAEDYNPSHILFLLSLSLCLSVSPFWVSSRRITLDTERESEQRRRHVRNTATGVLFSARLAHEVLMASRCHKRARQVSAAGGVALYYTYLGHQKAKTAKERQEVS